MSSSKIFAGNRLRRLRQKLGLSQTALAQTLGLSASYLNLMERDQRPLTAQVLLKLSGLEGVDIAHLADEGQAPALLQPLREMLADPLLVGEVPPGHEVQEAIAAAPNVAAATLKLYAAYREGLRRLADAARGLPAQIQAPARGVARWLAERKSDDIEALAEDVWSTLTPKDDVFAGLKAQLRSTFGVDTRILPQHILGTDRALYDRHAQRLNLSEMLDHESRVAEAALLLARLAGQSVIDEAVAASGFAHVAEEARNARAGLLAHLGLAITAPRGKFSAAAEDLKYDVATLARRFMLTPAHVLLRLAQLNEELGYLSVSATGRVLQHFAPLHVHLTLEAPLCGQLPIFDESMSAQPALLQPSEGPRLAVLALRHKGVAHGLFMLASDAKARGIDPAGDVRPLGSACRLCDIRNCAKRIEAPALQPQGLNDYRRAATDFEPV